MNRQSPKKITMPGISPFIVMGVLLVLIPIFVFITLDGIRQHNQRVVEKLTGKGLFLIRAFEAGTRNGMLTMRWGVARVQRLLSETARLPEVHYMMIVTDKGKILAHSDPFRVGETYDFVPDIAATDKTGVALHRQTRGMDGSKVFEVFKQFTPANRRMGPGEGGGPDPGCEFKGGQGCEGLMEGAEPKPGRMNRGELDWFRAHFFPSGTGIIVSRNRQFVIAGLSMDEAELEKQLALKHATVTGAVLFLIGCAGIVSLFAFQGYRSAKTSLSRVTEFSNKVVETMPAGLVSVDTGLEVTSLNAAAAAILKTDRSTQEGMGAVALPGEMIDLVREIHDRDITLTREIDCIGHDGEKQLLDISVSPMRDDTGAVSGYLLVFRDLTEIRTLKKEIERSRRLAAVGKLAAGVAHEIRNPLSSIKGFATYLKDRLSNPKEDGAVADIMISEVERLNRAVTQLLEFAKPVPVIVKTVGIDDVITHSLKLVEQDLTAKGITVRTHLETRTNTVSLDPDRLNQILLNLYLNAIQAMDKGGELTVSMSDHEREGVLAICVSDTGQGIDDKAIDHIFDPYFTTRPEGTGLGLAMVHRAVEAMGGDIRVESSPDAGARFFLHIPCAFPGDDLPESA